MADVMVVCSGCGAKFVASEFADSVVCRVCGKSTQVRTPASAPTAGSPGAVGGSKSGGLKLKEVPVHGSSIKPSADIEEIVRKVKTRAGDQGSAKAQWGNNPLVGWAVFLIFGGLCAWARFGNLLPTEYHQMMVEWGPLAALFFHAVVVVKAFEDSVFYGSLCLLLPPYTFFYLFSVCDQFILRALYMGVLAGVGIDTYFALKKLIIETYISFNSWILSGG